MRFPRKFRQVNLRKTFFLPLLLTFILHQLASPAGVDVRTCAKHMDFNIFNVWSVILRYVFRIFGEKRPNLFHHPR